MNSKSPAPDEDAPIFPEPQTEADAPHAFVDEATDVETHLNEEVMVDDIVIAAAILDETEEDEDDEPFDFAAFNPNTSEARGRAMPSQPEPDAKPERVSKLISRAGLASRRAAEEMISEGRVSINGHFVREPGLKADPTRDRIVVDNRPLAVSEKTTTVVVLHKPKYVMTTRDDPGGRTTVFDLLPKKFAAFYAVGRLDFETTGVLLLTDDGALAHLLTHPSHGVEKVYQARVRGEVSTEAIQKLREGLYLEDGKTAPCRARVAAQREKNALVELTLREGRNRQVRRMLEAVGHAVSSLRRVKFAGVELEGLLPGTHRILLPGEVKALRRSVESGLKDAKRAKRAAFDPSIKPKTKPARKPLFGPSKTKLAAQAAARENTSNSPNAPRGKEKPVGPYEIARQNARRFADAEEKRLAKPGAARRSVPLVDEARVPKVREKRARVEDLSNPLRSNDARPSGRGEQRRAGSSSTRGAASNGFGRAPSSRENAPRASRNDSARTTGRPPRPSSTNSQTPFKPSAPKTSPRFEAAPSRSNFNREDARESLAPRAPRERNASSTNRANPNSGAARDNARAPQPRTTDSRTAQPRGVNPRDTPARNPSLRDAKPRDAKPRDERAKPTSETPLARRIERKWR